LHSAQYGQIMLVLTIVLAVLNIFLGFALAAYLGRGPSGIFEILEFFSFLRSRAVPESEEMLLPSSENPIAETLEQTLPATQTPLDNTAVNASSAQSDCQPSESAQQSSEYTDSDAFPDESNLDLVCNEVS